MATKYVYFFGNGDADGDESMRAELGGKGANLAQMAKKPLSLPVPPGFTITTHNHNRCLSGILQARSQVPSWIGSRS